jgi:hypothetical protein
VAEHVYLTGLPVDGYGLATFDQEAISSGFFVAVTAGFYCTCIENMPIFVGETLRPMKSSSCLFFY